MRQVAGTEPSSKYICLNSIGRNWTISEGKANSVARLISAAK